MNSIQLLIKDICQEENISFQPLSKDWVLLLNKEGESHYIVGSKFDLNNHASAKICNDKYACYDVLKYHNIPVCEHHILYQNTSREEVEKCFFEYNSDVVLKANGGSYGDGVYHVSSFEDLFSTMESLFQKHYSISMMPFYSILMEYRIIVLKGEVELIYGKKRPIVVGDGVHTIYELLCSFNYPFFKSIQDSSLERVLLKGEVFEYSWQYNLAKGSIPVMIEDESLKNRLSQIALLATKSLNLDFVSVDIVELPNHELKVLEINSGVVTNIADYFPDGEKIAKEIYRKAVLSMFEK